MDGDHLALVIADVSGKGGPAALFMVIAKTMLKNRAQSGASPKEVLEAVNDQLCENNEAEMFVTVWLGILEISTGKMTCANAGHEYPALRRAGEQYELVKDKHGFVLAGMEHACYREYGSGTALLEAAEGETGFDLYLLNLLIQELSGIELGVRLRKLDERGAIIYLSGSSDYAMEAYRARAFDYLLKPAALEQLFLVLDLAITSLDRRKAVRVMVKTHRGTRLIPADDILYMELMERTAHYHLAGGEEVSSVTLRVPFQAAAAPLRFIRCGTSFVVNLYYVSAMERGCFCLADESRIPLPRKCVSHAKRAWTSYWLPSG